MEHFYGILAIFVLSFIISLLIYKKNPEKLIVYHNYSIVVDILSWIGGLALIFLTVLYYDIRPEYNYLLWVQVVIGSGLFNIHMARFIIHLKTKDQYHYKHREKAIVK